MPAIFEFSLTVQSHEIDGQGHVNNVEYLRWLQDGVSKFGKLTSLRKYLVLRPSDNTVLAKAQTNWAFISWPQRTPRRCPPELVAAFELVPEDQEPTANSLSVNLSTVN